MFQKTHQAKLQKKRNNKYAIVIIVNLIFISVNIIMKCSTYMRDRFMLYECNVQIFLHKTNDKKKKIYNTIYPNLGFDAFSCHSISVVTWSIQAVNEFIWLLDMSFIFSGRVSGQNIDASTTGM